MGLVKSEVSHRDFISGRTVRDCCHLEDGVAGFVVGEVDDVRADDIEITQREYDTLATDIRAHNDAIPKPDPIPSAPETYAALATDAERIAFLAKRMDLV